MSELTTVPERRSLVRRQWERAVNALIERYLPAVANEPCTPIEVTLRADDDREGVMAIVMDAHAIERRFMAEKLAYNAIDTTLAVGASVVLLGAPFLVSFLGFIPWGWVPVACGALGLIIDLFGVLVLTRDAMEQTAMLILEAPDGIGRYGGDAVWSANLARTNIITRTARIRQLWRAPRRGLYLVFGGFLLQASAQSITLGTLLHPLLTATP